MIAYLTSTTPKSVDTGSCYFRINNGREVLLHTHDRVEQIRIPNQTPHLLSGVYSREAYAIAKNLVDRREVTSFESLGMPLESITIFRILTVERPDITLSYQVAEKELPSPFWISEVERKLFDEQMAYAEKKCLQLSEESTIPPNLPSFHVAIAHYNHGPQLVELLKSLELQDHKDFSVCVVDDGSHDPLSLRIFDQLKNTYANRGWHFLSQENKGPSSARNLAAQAGMNKDFLLFMDADNLASPQMLTLFARHLSTRKLDCATSWFTAFREDAVLDNLESKLLYTYCPLGGSLLNARYENVLGDTNFAIRPHFFSAVGEFSGNKRYPWEDWLLLAKIQFLPECRFDVIPEPTFYYRLMAQGRNRNITFSQDQFLPIFNVISLKSDTLMKFSDSRLIEATQKLSTKLRSFAIHSHRSKFMQKLIFTLKRFARRL